MSIHRHLKLKEDEEVLHIVRQYGLTLIWSWLAVGLLMFTSFFFMFWLFQHGWWGQLLFAIPVVGAVIIGLRTLFVWNNNALVITSHRLFDIEQRGFFEKVISEIHYHDVEDISTSIKGFWATMLKFGTTTIETAEGTLQFVLKNIKKPHDTQDVLHDLIGRHKKKLNKTLQGDAAKAIIAKIKDLELEQLIRIEKVVHNQIDKLTTDE
jgi:hypothetical protein